MQFIYLYFILDGQNNGSNSSANAQVVPVASSSMSSTVFIALLTEICEMLKKNKKTRDRVHSSMCNLLFIVMFNFIFFLVINFILLQILKTDMAN